MGEQANRKPHVVFERMAAQLVREGADVELIARGKKGTRDIDGWYMMIRQPDGRRLLVLTVREAKLKFTQTIIAVFRMLERMSAKEILVPLEAQIETEGELWALHARLNAEAGTQSAG
ncbi:hypothetical protein HOY34_07385 [Xinfangfangia sp. D13-10-4-6]|uniref:hypothetical protein n=1 Tax=Pseudogemmobacter hezensis TaxID=2737662 RepID=UPI00155378F4|nr:hypothetical protein [Pseudogemmobacter hezensis]NPD15026.1 hypothetical protein [Pseudogemmobacter hezensis]